MWLFFVEYQYYSTYFLSRHDNEMANLNCMTASFISFLSSNISLGFMKKYITEKNNKDILVKCVFEVDNLALKPDIFND